jgi:hypothetical protein
MPKYKPLYSLYKGLRENKYDVPDSYVSFQKTLTQPGNAGAKSRRGLYQSLKDSNYDVPDTYEDFYKNLFVPVNSTTSRALKIGENPNTPTVNRYRQKMFNSVDPNKSRASELTHRAIGQAVRATNNVRKPVVANVVNRKGKPTGENFAITPAKTVEDLDREYAQETTKNWENELHDQMADADKDAAKISYMFKSFIGSTDEVGSVWGNITRGGGIAGTPHSVTTNNGILENTEARQILAAGDYNRKRRELLQLEQDSRNGAIFDNHSFFRGMYDAAKDTGFLTGGASDLINAGSLLATKQDLDNGVHTEAGDMLMQQAVKNSDAQSQYGDNQGWMYTGGVITTNMAPFMVQIGSAGFSKGMSTSIGKVVQGAASKVALGTMEKATGMAGAHIANYIGKVTGLTTKAFGKAIQYGIVGAAQANTVGLGNVANDVINRYTGQVYQDEQGNYKFGTFDSDGKLVHEGGEDFLTSLVKGEAAQTIEFATELSGGGIDAVGTALKNFVTKGGKKIINKYNMENVSKVIDFLLNNKVSKHARYLKAGADRTLGNVELNSIVGESLEEELGIIANTVFTGDNKISDLWDEKQQSQIWGGMLLSIGLMKGAVAPFHAYNAKQYYSYKHKLDKADVNLSQLLGKEKWEELRNQIDATTNEDMPEMVNKINRDVALGKNRQPVREYIQNLLIMRGYDIGNMLAAKKAVEDKGKGVSVKNMEKNQAYQQGRDAYGYDTHEIQLDQADKQKTLAQLLGITEQQLSTMSDEELDNLSGRDDNLYKAIYDYQLSTIRYQGVADNAQDQVDLAAQKAAQAVDMYTDKSRNTIRNATIKATGGLEDYGVYIINGNIATHDDGSIDVGNSDDMILFYDPTTNTVEHADATRFAELGSEENADEVRNQAVADAKENAIKEITGIIDGVVEVGTQFKTIDADGTEHTYEVLADNGDGTAMITIDGNIPTQLVKGENVNVPVSFEELQKMKDASDQQRLQAAKAQREQMEKERAEQQMQAQTTQAENPAQENNTQSAPIEDNLDYSDIIREDGKVQMVDVSDKDGNNLFPDVKDVFYIQGNKMRTKFAYIDANGELKKQSFPTGLVKIKTRGEVSVDDYKKYRSMILSAESSAMPESSMIEDNSGTIEGDRGGIEVNDELPPVPDNVTINGDGTYSVDGAVQGGENTTAPAEQTEQTPAMTLEDGTIVPMLEDGNPDFSKLTADQTAELYDSQFGEDADSVISGWVSDAKKALDKANNMTVKGKNFVEQKAAKEAKEKAIADAQAAYDSAIAIRDAYNSRQLAKVEDTAEGRKNLIEKARRKFSRLKSAVKDDAEAVSQLYKDVVGSLLHRLYDGTGIDVTDTIPLTAEEYVASNLGAHSLNYEGTETSKGVKQETGLSREDFAKTQLLAADGKGTTIDDLVHSLWENRPSNLESLDTQDIRNALIGVLNSGFKASEARNYIENLRIAQAENFLEEQKKAADNAAFAEEQKAPAEEQTETAPESEEKTGEDNSDEINDEENEQTNAPEQNNFPDKLREGSKAIEVPEDATDENPLGLQLSKDKVPFEIKGEKSGETYDINDKEDRKRLVAENSVDDKDILDIDMPKHVHKAIKELCKKMGLKVQFLYMGARLNGWVENGTMYLALDANKATQFVFGHEMTHAIKQKNPEAYKELVKVAMAVTTKKEFEEDLAKIYRIYHNASGYNNIDDFVEEVIADNIGKFINDHDLAQRFVLRLNHPVLATILHAIQKIKGLLYGDPYKSVDALERIVEKAYVDTANGQVTNSETGEDVSYSLRQKPEPKKKGVGYKVFVLKDGKLYPPMVANPNGAATPVGVWLDADAAPIAGESKTGRPQVKQGGKGTQGGSGKLAYRPGWHLGVVPYAIQFNRKDAEGNKTLFPKNFVFAEVEYAADVDYQEEARQEGINPSGKYQHSLAGLKHLPTDGYYMYRTNPNPETDPWVITGAMKVNRILTRAEQAELVKNAGREPQQIQEGDIVTDDVVNSINQEIAAAPKFSLKVYHGSGADFTEFDFDHMGEGEGSQAFGWGGYVTSSEEIGEDYTRRAKIRKDNGGFEFVTDLSADNKDMVKQYIYKYKDVDKGLDAMRKDLPDALELFPDDENIKELSKVLEKKNEEIAVPDNIAYLYDVDIPEDNGSNYLDWDAPITDELIDKVAKVLPSLRSYDIVDLKKDRTFDNFYKTISMRSVKDDATFNDDKAASQLLSSLGYTGIKYKAGRIFGGAKEGDTNYVIFKPEDMRITEHTKFSLKKVNDAFNQRLDELVKNPDQKDKILRLGRSSSFLKAGGIVDAEIELDFDKLMRKSKQGYVHEHPFDATDVKDLPMAIANPISVFDNTNGRNDGQVILTELKKEDRNFIVAIQTENQNRRGGVILKVNKIVTLFPKDARGVINWFNQGKATNIDKEKALHFIEALQNHSGTTITDEELKSAANIINSFETAKENGEKVDSDGTKFSLKDEEYLKAVEDGNMEKAQKMVNEAADAAGYSTDSSYQGTSAFNGAAPWGNGYFLTKDERKEAWDNGEFEGESTLGDYINDDIDGGNLEELTNAASYRAADPMRKEAIDNVRNAIQKKAKTITMYRSVPSDVKEGSFRNGDWVTPSRAYAVDNAKLHGWGDDYNIIEQKVPVDDVWFDGNDIAEWGYGREEDYINDTDFAYKNSKNNKKLLDAVTYDDNGNVIPLSQRFNEKNNDVRFSLKEEKTMFGMHNISIDKLRKAIKQGGFAAPSMGVVDSKNGIYSDYGEITLIPKAEKLAKRTGKNAGTFTADAWTPTYPQVERIMNKQGEKVFNTDMNEKLGDVDNGIYSNIRESWKGYLSSGDVRDGLYWHYLFDKGMNPETIYQTGKYDNDITNEVMRISDNGNKTDYTDEEVAELIRLMNNATGKDNDVEAQREKLKARIASAEKQGNHLLVALKKKRLAELEGVENFYIAADFVKDVVRNNRKNGKVDVHDTMSIAKEKVENDKKLSADFPSWLDKKTEEYGVEEMLYNGTTPSGKPKYIPNTIDNAVKLMKKQGVAGGYTAFGSELGVFIAKNSTEVNTLAAMKNAKDKLIPFGDERHNQIKDKITKEFLKLSDEIRVGSNNRYAFDDSGVSRMVELTDHKGNEKEFLKKAYNVEVSDEWMDRYNKLLDTIKKDYKVFYFETKFMRPYGLDEFEKAIVPSDTPSDVVDALKKAGIDVSSYERGNAEDRQKVTMDAINSSDNIRFSLRGSTPYDKQMEEWMEKNHLEKGAVPMEKPIMKEGENIFDYANRMVEWTRNQNLWKTAPKKTGFQDALAKWKADNGLSPDAYPPVRPHRENYSTEIGYTEDLEEYNKKKELWKSAPKPKDFDLSVDLEDMNKQIRNIRRAVLNQKNYDQRTVKAVSDLVRKMLNIGWGDGLSRGKVGNLLSAAKNATGVNDVKKYLDKAMGILAENYLNRLSTAYDNLINTKGARADQSGVIKMGSLDAKGQAFMSEYKKAINMDDSSLNTYIANIEEDSAKNEDNVEMNDYRLAGIQAAIMYKQQIGGNDADISELQRQIGELKNKKDATKEDKDLLKSLEKKLFENKFDRITMFENLLNNIQRMVKESKGRAKEFREEIAEHKNEILHRANLDLEGVDSTYYDTTTAKKKLVNNDLQRAVFSSTYTFEQFLKFFGKKAANGEGYLYNYFTKLNQDALDEEQLYNEMNRNALDEKTKELFGKEKFMKLVGIDGKGMKEMDVEVTDYSNKETGKRTIHLKQGQMLYIYLVNKETDGEMKLRAMGITEEDVAAIEENLDPRVKAMGEWLQDEYLPECQRRYQATHTKYFGAPMKEVENYFPLAINNRARNVKEDVNQDSDAMSQLAGTSTGAIVTRRVNVIPLDIENADAFEVAFNHLQEMEEWSAMLPFRQDINTLLSYTHFRNQVQNMSSVAYGSGKTLWDEFKQTAQIAAGTYKPKVNAGMMDSRIAAAMGGIAVAKISGRLWTAIKQSQSATVFLPECDFTRFVKNGVNPYGSWKWAMENIPDFRKRVENMTYGDVKLRQYLDELEKWHDWTKTISKIGMAPNILVDGITCAVGARSVYETEVNRLTKLGYPKEKAEEKAYYKAVAAYNKTQQSSGGMYLSPMQVDRTYASAALSLFKNANYAYGRMQIEACRGLARTYDFWGGKHKTTLIESMTRQIMEEDGLDENTARAIAKATYNRTFRQSIGRLINFATLVPVSWALYKVLPYLLTGDDDDKKTDMIEEAVLKGFATSLSDNYVIPFASNILNAGLKVEDGKPTFDPEVFKYQNLYINPATSDLANIYSMIGNQKWYSVANKLGMLGVQSLIGFNPETVGALYQAFAEADYDNGNTAKEWQIGILKAISAPEESIRELYMDELGLKSGDKDAMKKFLSLAGLDADDINKVPLAELEKRYAERQINRDNLLSQIGMDADTFNGYVDKYQKSFEKKIKDKMDKWDEYDKKKADEFFDTTSDPKLKDMIAKKRANDANAAADEQIAKEGLNQEKKGKEPSEEAYDAVKMSIDVAEDNAISTYNKVLNKRYAALNDEYNNQTDAMKYIFMSKHPNFKAYKDLKSEYTTYGKKIKELKEKLVSADGYDAKQTILKQIRSERDKFYELQSKVR